jgi:hypothetical protein
MSVRATYEPHPLDVTGIAVPRELARLREQLAENVHEVWAAARLNEGWRYGPARDDARREHPGLVPYADLADSERDYDRATADATVKYILALGYQISAPGEGAPHWSDPSPSPSLREALSQLSAASEPSFSKLLSLWNGRERHLWATHREAYQLLARRLIEIGESLLAHEVASEGVDVFPRDLSLRYLMGLALARSGATRQANALAVGLCSELPVNAEIAIDAFGLLGRTCRELALMSSATEAREARTTLTANARDAYMESFRRGGGSYPAVNTALAELMLENRAEADRWASIAVECATEELVRAAATGADRYFAVATLAEAALIAGRDREAEQRYREAATEARGRYGDLASTRRQAKLIAQLRGGALDWLDDALSVPAVAVLGGAGSAEGDPSVLREAIRTARATHDIGFAFSLADSDMDLDFLEEMAAHDARTFVVLADDDGGASPALTSPLDQIAARRAQVIARATEVIVAGDAYAGGSGAASSHTRMLLRGLAMLHARRLGSEMIVLDADPFAAAFSTAASQPATRTAGILFADVAGFSRLSEVQVGHFVREFLGAVARLATDGVARPIVSNTWGDGLFFLFDDVRSTGLFALALCALVRETPWESHGLPADLAIRIAVHVGPLLPHPDPLTGQPALWGRHLSRAARIEPVTPSGVVYATRDFAAYATAENVGDFVCEPVGRVALAKRAGVVPLYALVPARAATSSHFTGAGSAHA